MDVEEVSIMAIKMRRNKNKDAVCCECGEAQKDVLEMFDLCINRNIFTICDICNEKIFCKTLHASVMLQEKVKSPRDMKIIRIRKANGIERWSG